MHPFQIIELTGPKAAVRVHHEVAYDFNEKNGLYVYRQKDEDEVVYNLITYAGRVQLHTQCYATGSMLTNGFNWIGLTNDSDIENASDTVLAGEFTADGLQRQQGTVTLPTGVGNSTQIQKVFTYVGVGSQSVQKAALFTEAGPPPAGVMAHEVKFTPRVLATSDNFTVTYTITLG
jgi:hypothetical protein